MRLCAIMKPNDDNDDDDDDDDESNGLRQEEFDMIYHTCAIY